jgi:hypothetical protein
MDGFIDAEEAGDMAGYLTGLQKRSATSARVPDRRSRAELKRQSTRAQNETGTHPDGRSHGSLPQQDQPGWKDTKSGTRSKAKRFVVDRR